MTYSVKECFATIQGEGVLAGRVSVLCRMTGCNLWSGREADRASAICQFCDTDFVGTDGDGGGRFSSASLLATHIERVWTNTERHRDEHRYVFFTGGEPLLQLDGPLIEACHALEFEVGIESNGTLPCPPGIDWICVSPKASAPLRIQSGHELKLVYPQDNVDPSSFESLNFAHFSLQPRDDADRKANTEACIAYCMAHPRWRLSVQLHKISGLR